MDKHVEVLMKARSLIEFEVKHSPNANAAWTSWHNEKIEALTAAIAALEFEREMREQVKDWKDGRVSNAYYSPATATRCAVNRCTSVIVSLLPKEPTNDN